MRRRTFLRALAALSLLPLMPALPALPAETHIEGPSGIGIQHWDVELTEAEVRALSQGLNPLHIRPGHLVYWCPLWGGGGWHNDLRLDKGLVCVPSPSKAKRDARISPSPMLGLGAAAAATQHTILRGSSMSYNLIDNATRRDLRTVIRILARVEARKNRSWRAGWVQSATLRALNSAREALDWAVGEHNPALEGDLKEARAAIARGERP